MLIYLWHKEVLNLQRQAKIYQRSVLSNSSVYECELNNFIKCYQMGLVNFEALESEMDKRFESNNINTLRGSVAAIGVSKPTFAVKAEKLYLPNNAVFIVIPKTGCTSVKTFFTNYYGWTEKGGRAGAVHDPSSPIYQHILRDDLQQEKYRGYFVFTFVRNPFSRLYSAYKSKIRNNGVNPPLWIDSVAPGLHAMGVRKGCSFSEFVELICNTPDERCDPHVKPQWQFVVSADGKLLVDEYYRFENYQQEFLKALVSLGIDDESIQVLHLNREQSNPNEYVEHYNPRLIDLVVGKYNRDFEIFKYAKDI